MIALLLVVQLAVIVAVAAFGRSLRHISAEVADHLGPAEAAYRAGYDYGYDEGYAEGRKTARPVVVPLRPTGSES